MANTEEQIATFAISRQKLSTSNLDDFSFKLSPDKESYMETKAKIKSKFDPDCDRDSDSTGELELELLSCNAVYALNSGNNSSEKEFNQYIGNIDSNSSSNSNIDIERLKSNNSRNNPTVKKKKKTSVPISSSPNISNTNISNISNISLESETDHTLDSSSEVVGSVTSSEVVGSVSNDGKLSPQSRSRVGWGNSVEEDNININININQIPALVLVPTLVPTLIPDLVPVPLTITDSSKDENMGKDRNNDHYSDNDFDTDFRRFIQEKENITNSSKNKEIDNEAYLKDIRENEEMNYKNDKVKGKVDTKQLNVEEEKQFETENERRNVNENESENNPSACDENDNLIYAENVHINDALRVSTDKIDSTDISISEVEVYPPQEESEILEEILS